MKVKVKELVELFVSLGVDSAVSWSVEKVADRVNREDGGLAHYPKDDLPLTEGEENLYDAIVAFQQDGGRVEVDPEDEGEGNEFSLVEKESEESDGELLSESESHDTLGDGQNQSASGAVAVADPPAPPKTRVRKGASKKDKPKKAKAEKKTGVRKKEVKPRKTRGRHAISTDPDLSWKDRIAGWKKKPYPLTDRGPGVVRSIVEMLRKAGDVEEGVEPKGLTKEEIHAKLVKKFHDRDPAKMLKTVNNQVPTQLKQYRQIFVWKTKKKVGSEMITAYYIPQGENREQPKPKKEKK